MITIRKAEERGHANHGWLDTYHTFSFAGYHDPRHMGFRDLRVINEDRVAPAMGFGTHAHRDMEIISWVLEGGLQHRDSMHNGGVIRPRELQRMSAGTGVRHSEFNASETDVLHFLQIWILPEGEGIQPGYEQKSFADEELRNTLRLIASRQPAEGAVKIHQDVDVYAGILDRGEEVRYELRPGRHAWVHVARGELELNGRSLRHGDGAAVSEESALTLTGTGDSEVLLFDLR